MPAPWVLGHQFVSLRALLQTTIFVLHLQLDRITAYLILVPFFMLFQILQSVVGPGLASCL